MCLTFKIFFSFLIAYLTIQSFLLFLQRQLLPSSGSEAEEESIEPTTLQRDATVHEAVSRAVSNIMPSGMDTMTTLNETQTPGIYFIYLLLFISSGIQSLFF